MMDHINPYRHRMGLIELPRRWSLDDAICSLFCIRDPRPILANSHIRKVRKEELREIHAWAAQEGKPP